MLTSFCLCNNKNEKFKQVIIYKNETIFQEFEGTIIGQCINCGLLKTFPSKKNKFFKPKDSRGEMYDNNSQKFIQLLMPIIQQIKQFKNKGKILDVGCASGLLLSLLEKQGYKVNGIEPNEIAFKLAYKKLGNKIFNGTLNDYVKQNKHKFDCVIYNHVLEHIEDIDKEIKLVKKVLKNDGIFVVGVPNTSNIIFLLRQKYWEPLMPNEHIWHFNSKYLINIFNKFNLKVISKSYADDKREDYPAVKRLYFKILSLINKLFYTGETILLIMVLSNKCKKKTSFFN